VSGKGGGKCPATRQRRRRGRQHMADLASAPGTRAGSGGATAEATTRTCPGDRGQQGEVGPPKEGRLGAGKRAGPLPSRAAPPKGAVEKPPEPAPGRGTAREDNRPGPPAAGRGRGGGGRVRMKRGGGGTGQGERPFEPPPQGEIDLSRRERRRSFFCEPFPARGGGRAQTD